jgi:DNA-binding transcriptional regulator GbsR (MarR family)
MNAKRDRAIDIAAATMADLMDFWGFKSSMGRIWTLLYLSRRPLPADEISTRTGLSSGAVSMGLAELQQWGIAEKAVVSGERKRHYQAETDVWGIVRRIFRERELRLIDKAKRRFKEAADLLESIEDPDEDDLHALKRLRGLQKLATIGYSLVETFGKVGMFTLEPIRGALSRGG